MKTLTGRDAITQARRTGAQLYAYSDPVSEGGPISLAEAEERVAIDPSLVYLPAAVEWSQTDDGANVRVSYVGSSTKAILQLDDRRDVVRRAGDAMVSPTEDSTVEAVAREILDIGADRAGLVRAADAYLLSLEYDRGHRLWILQRLGVSSEEVRAAWEVVGRWV